MIIDIYTLIWLSIVGLGLLFWWKSMGTRQRMLVYVARYCDKQALQLLDQSISLQKIRIGKNSANQIRLLRVYRFEFTSTGEQRYGGLVYLAGSKVENIELDPFRVGGEEIEH